MKNDTAEYSVYITKSAENDLNQIISYIAENNPRNALEIYERLKAKIFSLSQFPNKGAYVPELLKQNIKDYRQLLEKPWRIIYKVEDTEVKILLVLDSRRNVQDILFEKLIA
ncbi:plasmid stabilization protein [Spirochaetia bacterium]|nr:plasmid stabilization protein [Spirochaetia bacterium]